YIVIQVYNPKLHPQLYFELHLKDIQHCKRRLIFSTNFREIQKTPLHTKLPISQVIRDTWLNLCFDLYDLCYNCFDGAQFCSLEKISIGPYCNIRKIFTMKQNPK